MRHKHWVPFIFVNLILSLSNCAGYQSSSDCEATSDPKSDNVLLICKLRTLNWTFNSANLSLIESSKISSLTLLCDDITFDQARLSSSFSSLSSLEILKIDGCKLSDLSSDLFIGLSSLSNLTISSHNYDWSDLNLRLSSKVFNPLVKLKNIDLSSNAITSLPESLFCHLPNLLTINLARNSFSEISSIGFSTKNRAKDVNRKDCTIGSVDKLDLSLNRIRVLTDRGFASLSKLSSLILKDNLITRAEDNSLSGLNNLTYLDLSNNELVALSPRFFQPVAHSIKSIQLSNNSISILPPGLFNGLHQLALLDLSHNEITSHWIGVDTFSDLSKLIQLNLSFNRIARIDSSTFKSQIKLEILNLDHNEIETIAESAFASLSNLHTLVISHNHLTRLDSPLSLSRLYSLTLLSLDHNRIESIHSEAFTNLTNLFELNLSFNRLSSTLPSAITKLRSLRTLDLSSNQIWNISSLSYQGNQQLFSLNLEGNRIGNLSRGTFNSLISLGILNLAKNRIESIESGTFDDVPNLHALRLDSNFITDINDLFNGLTHLLMLNISANKITMFDYALIPLGLQWLDLHDNLIDKLGNYFQVESSLKLLTLDCSYNQIMELDPSSLPNGIEVVFLNNNAIRKVAPFTFMGKQNLTRVNLSNNQLATLDTYAFRLSKVRSRRPLPEFSVADNPYICDCNMEWLQRMTTVDDSRQYPKMVDIDKIVCRLFFTKHRSTIPLVQADSSQFLCPYKSHCFALCHCCEFDACDCEMTCPENCTCFYDQAWNANIVDCSYTRHQVVPPRIPMDATELYLDGNDIPTLSSHAFIGRKNMKVLHLNNSNIFRINNRTFNGLKSLQVLNLNHNRLIALYGYEFERLFDLKELYISYNEITSIANNTFTALKVLRILHIDHNYLVNFELWNLNINRNLQDLRVSANPWSCECYFVNALLEWIPSKAQIISDSNQFECTINSTNRLSLLPDFNLSMCTNYSSRSSLAQRFQMENFVPLVVISGSFIVIFIFILIVMLIYRREMSVWFYSRYGVRLQSNGSKREEEKLFDAFVSYSKKDEAFVSQVLAPELEYGSPSFRLCLHYRDLPVASGYLSDAIVEAMESSQRTVIVISDNFLKGEWCRYEFKSAHLEVLRHSHQKLIIICIGKINSKDLDPDIRYWLKTNTFLQWDEKLFWEKLRYAMPDIAYTRKPAEQTRDLSIAVHI